MYRLGIWLIAFAVVFNGVTGAFAWTDAPDPPGAVAHDPQGSAGAGHHDNAVEGVAAAVDNGQTHGGVQNHLKCCARCNVVSLLPGIVAIPVMFTYVPLGFRTTQDHLVGHHVILDPGIPKSAV